MRAGSRSRAVGELSAELEALSVRALAASYGQLNSMYFGGQLRRPVLGLSETLVRLGHWDARSRSMELSRSLLLAEGWGAAVEVLKHEMAHQYVDEVLGLRGEPAHGPAFRRVCEQRGIEGRAMGIPDADRGGDAEAHVLERIAKLLALAESPNLHEAQAAMQTAGRLMLKYNIETVRTGASNSCGFRHLGKPLGRVDETQRILASILGSHFFVEAIWVSVWRPLEAKRGSLLEICGTRANLEIAEYVYGFLLATAEGLWREYKRAHGIEKNRDRRSYIAGVMAGFRDKLDEQQATCKGEGLVWVGDAALHHYFRRRHPRVRTTRHWVQHGEEAHAEGRKAGRHIVLHRGMQRGASGTIKLLPPR